jgi:hypothetical protein
MRLLVLHFAGASCAIVARELIAIDHDGPGAKVGVDGPVRDLTDFVPGDACEDRPPLRLIVHHDGRRHGFRACARLELFETSILYRLPQLVRELGAAPWIRGVALVRDALPTLWIDLARLALASEQETCPS